MPEQTGLMHFWAQGDAVTHFVSIVLVAISMVSWYVIVSKAIAHWRYRQSCGRALSAFWSAPALPAALEALHEADRTGMFTLIANAGAQAAQEHQKQGLRNIAAGALAGDFIKQALRQAMLQSQTHLEQGLTFLASIGATAPFIGLFGTVWGIYHALVGLAGATQVVLEKVAGPVGEALIMTAAGLFVAIPAVLGYNACVRANRLVLAQLDAFAHGLHAYFAAGIRLDTAQPAHQSAPSALPQTQSA